MCLLSNFHCSFPPDTAFVSTSSLRAQNHVSILFYNVRDIHGKLKRDVHAGFFGEADPISDLTRQQTRRIQIGRGTITPDQRTHF